MALDFTADFSTINITADRTVHLDSARTIGQIKFQDTNTGTGNAFNWFLDNNNVASNILTLDNGASQPVINVINRTTTLSAVLAGTNGVLLTGGTGGTGSQLNLAAANTYSGVTTITTNTTNQMTVLRKTTGPLERARSPLIRAR